MPDADGLEMTPEEAGHGRRPARGIAFGILFLASGLAFIAAACGLALAVI